MFYPKEVWTDHPVTTPIHVAACAQMVVTQAGSHVVARQHTQTPFRLELQRDSAKVFNTT